MGERIASRRRTIPLLRALALLALLLLPIQMRAGAQDPHPHALLHLLLDASDGSFDHHVLGEEPAAPTHDYSAVTAAGAHQPDIPSFETSVSAAGGLAILAALVAILMLPPPLAKRIWLRIMPWRGRFPALDPPPPASRLRLNRTDFSLSSCGTCRGTQRRPSIMRRISLFAAVGSIVLSTLVVLTSPLVAEAHETRIIADGHYQMVVGFMNEPVFAGDKSGLEFWVTETAAATPVAGEEETEGTPVEGLEDTLQAEVIYEDQTMALPLSPKFGEPGGYYSVFFPTASEGDYTFRVYGAIDGTEIDETFTSGPETFGPVEDPAPLQFPQP